MRLILSISSIVITLLVFKIAVANKPDKPFVIIGTSGVTGVYYAAGHAVAKVFERSETEYDFRLDAESSSGSTENIQKVLSGEWSFGIAQADILYSSIHGEGTWQGNPATRLRAIAVLHPESLTIIAAAGEEIETIQDLSGKKVGFGSSDFTGKYINSYLLEVNETDPNKNFKAESIAAIEAPEMLQKGNLDAYFYTVGHPNLFLYESSFGNRPVKLIPLDSATIDDLLQSYPYLVPVRIPMFFYDTFENEGPVNTVGVKAVLFTSEDVAEYQVSAILKAIIDEFPRFQRQHPAFSDLVIDDLPHGTIAPLHSGAYRVYKEKGLVQ